jgi:hypothetical protein
VTGHNFIEIALNTYSLGSNIALKAVLSAPWMLYYRLATLLNDTSRSNLLFHLRHFWYNNLVQQRLPDHRLAKSKLGGD